MTDAITPTPSTLAELALTFTADVPAKTQLAAVLAAAIPSQPMMFLTRDATGGVFSFCPKASLGVAAAMLSDALGQQQDQAGPSVAWPMLKVTFGDGLGAASKHVDGAMTGGAFTTIGFDTVVSDTHGGFNTASGIYKVPQDGVYDVGVVFRIADGDIGGTSYGIGAGTANGDGPDFIWTTGAAERQGETYRALLTLKAGDPLRAFYYYDGAPPKYSVAQMTVVRIR